jgi:D-glucuronyl C5-epimerase C-terminus
MTPASGRLLVVLATALALLAAAPARAADVIVVDGDRATRLDDPFVPARAESDLTAPGARATAATASASRMRRPSARLRAQRRARRATSLALRRAYARGAISLTTLRGYRRVVARARTVRKRLKGARGRELGSAIALVDGMALRHELTASRLPAVLLILRRNTQYWPRMPFPRDRDRVTFRGSRLLFEYYVGNGLQLQPLANFKQANLMHGACVKDTGVACDRRGLERLLGELIRTASTRGGFKAWEYYFEFGGGSPPWISGMATATAIQAFGRAYDLTGHERYLEQARAAFAAFGKAPPTGVRTTGPFGGIHYLQYSFAPRLFIINAFLQSLIGLYDYAEITGDTTARRLFNQAEPEAREELPANDTGDWSTYSYRGAESTLEYHELLREFSASLCSRLRRKVYCDAARSFLSYMTDPAELELLGPADVTKGVPTRVRFEVSKLSAVQVTITRNGKVALDKVATFRRGEGSFAWKPGAVGTYRVRVAAKELRTGKDLRTSTTGEVESTAPLP